MGELSSEAKTRLAYLEFYKQAKDVSVVCNAFKISRQTFYKWQKRFNPSNLSTLEDQSKAPKSKRQGVLSLEKVYKSASSLSAFDFLLRLNLC